MDLKLSELPKKAAQAAGFKLCAVDKVLTSRGDPSSTFFHSPAMILAAITMAAQSDCVIERNLKTAMSLHAAELVKVDIELVRECLESILLSKTPSIYVRLMHEIGILSIIMPELSRCAGVMQDIKFHQFDIFTHCVNACDKTEPDLVLRLAALLHDIGKVDVREVVGTRTTFHKHEVASAKLVNVVLKRLRFTEEVRFKVLDLIRLHMYYYTEDFTDEAVWRFISRAGIREEDLADLENIPIFKLRIADRLGSGFKTIPITDRQTAFQDRIKAVWAKGRPAKESGNKTEEE